MTAYATHRKARFDYEILETYEMGIELIGNEVKAIRKGMARLEGSRALVRGNELFVVGLYIEPYQPKNAPEGYVPDQTRKLLASKKEITDLEEQLKNKGLTLIPLSLYNKGRKIKIEIALVRGKKKFDKRETIKKRDTDREIRREHKR